MASCSFFYFLFEITKIDEGYLKIPKFIENINVLTKKLMEDIIKLQFSINYESQYRKSDITYKSYDFLKNTLIFQIF